MTGRGAIRPLTISDAMGRGGNFTDHRRKSIRGSTIRQAAPSCGSPAWGARIRDRCSSLSGRLSGSLCIPEPLLRDTCRSSIIRIFT